jgi:phage tail sheath protein FI
MALTYKHPGVYVEEISTIPPSIAQVETAIPAFIGYTEKREKNGIEFGANLPQRITSLLEYEKMFGAAFRETLDVVINEPKPGENLPAIAVSAPTPSPYILYYHVKMFYENGGGPCYIVSVDKFDLVTPAVTKAKLKAGVQACEKEDEITLLVLPESIGLLATDIKELNDAMLAQCAKLQDRFTLIDVPQGGTTVITTVADNFRNNLVSSDNLKYGAAYYPQIQSGATITVWEMMT